MPAETPEQEPNPPSLFASTPVATEVLNRLPQGMGVRKPLLLLTGESGMGKSPLAREALRRFGDRATVAWMCEPQLEVKELPATVLGLFGGTTRPGTSPLAHAERLMMALANATSAGRIAVLVVDDAHTLSDDVLLELQRVAERCAQRQCPLEILLVGRPSLAERLTQPGLAAVAQQISLRFELTPLNAHHTRRYLLLLPAPAGAGHPPQFSRKACRDIHTASRGIPREIEAIAAESARLAARANATTVSPEHVRAAVQAIGARPAATPVAASKPAAVESKPVEAKAVLTPKHVTPVAKPAQAEAKPEPAKAQSAKPAVSVTSSGESTPSGEFVPSDDPRVKDWVAKFGGSGVRLGGVFTGPVRGEPVFDVADASVRDHDHVPAMASAGGSLDIRGETIPWPPVSYEQGPRRESRSRKGPVLGQRRRRNHAGPVVALLLVVAAAAVVYAQRQSWFASASDETNSTELVPKERPSEPRKRPDSKVKPSEPQASPVAKPEVAKPEVAQPKVAEPKVTAVPPVPKPRKPAVVEPLRVDRKPTLAEPPRVDRKPAATNLDRATSSARKPATDAATASVQASAPLATKKAKPAAAAAAKPGVHYTVLVGSFLKSDMAFAEREHLSRLTSHPVWVSRRSVGGVLTYRIILGAFSTSDIAGNVAQSLLHRGLVRDAKVLPLPLDP